MYLCIHQQIGKVFTVPLYHGIRLGSRHGLGLLNPVLNSTSTHVDYLVFELNLCVPRFAWKLYCEIIWFHLLGFLETELDFDSGCSVV